MAKMSFKDFLRTTEGDPDDHPLLRYYASASQDPDFKEARLEVRRPWKGLGYAEPTMYLHIISNGSKVVGYQREEWDDDLNEALLRRAVRCIDPRNETIRFNLGLAAAFERPQTRFGEGFFSSVLVEYIKDSPFVQDDEIDRILKKTATGTPYSGGQGRDDCRAMITEALRIQWGDLTERLRYGEDEADVILARALAGYLDDRFSVTLRERLGWE